MPLSLNTQWPGGRYYRVPAETPTEDVESRRGSWGRFEKGWATHYREHSFGGRSDDCGRGRSIWQIILTTLKAFEHIALIVLLFLLSLANTRPITVNIDRCNSQTSTIKSFVPDFPTKPTKFQSHTEFRLQHQRTHPQNDSWASLSPKDDGWISIPNPAQYNLSTSSSSPFPNTYMISAFHSLHCLEALQGGFLLLQEGKQINEKHIDHCLDYVRQTLTCNPDLTLESARKDERTGRHVTRGMGETHQCVDFGEVVEWANGHGDGSGSGKEANEKGFQQS